MDLPSIYAYLDYRTFLQDWIAARKQVEPGYSYAAFARAGGCSKAALSNVISGARSPRPPTLDAFARAMDLDPVERNLLGLLVELQQAPDLATRRQVMERVLATERYQQVRVAEAEPEGDVFRYLQHWYVPVIREMAGLEGFRTDPGWIAAQLRPPITEAQAAEALDTLLDLGFLERREDGTMAPAEIRFRTALESRQRAVSHYHREVVPELLRDLDSDVGDTQHLLAATLALPESLVPEAKARLNAVVEQLATLADDPTPGEATGVYQLSVQLLPVCEPMG